MGPSRPESDSGADYFSQPEVSDQIAVWSSPQGHRVTLLAVVPRKESIDHLGVSLIAWKRGCGESGPMANDAELRTTLFKGGLLARVESHN